MELHEFLKKHGRRVTSWLDAERRWGAGERVFVFEETGAGAQELTDMTRLHDYSVEQLVTIPAEVFKSEMGTESNAAAELERLKLNIRIELDLCDATDTPFVCANITTDDDYQKIEHLVIQKILSGKMTISQAIILIEHDLNPNMYEAF